MSDIEKILDYIKEKNELVVSEIIDLRTDLKKLYCKFDEVNDRLIGSEKDVEYMKKDINALWGKLREDRKEIYEMIQDKIKNSSLKDRLWIAVATISALCSTVMFFVYFITGK